MTEKISVNSQAKLSEAITKLTAAFREHKFVVVSYRPGKDRTLDQNALWFAMYQRIAQMAEIGDVEDARKYCKLHFGVPILRAEDAEFRESYDGSILRTLTYEQKLVAMDMLPVTSRMTTIQLSKYMTDVQDHYAKHGVALVFPEPERAAA